MRILQLNFEKGWRGGERQTLYCMRAFRKAGHEVEILCREGGPLQARARAEGFTAHGVRNVPGQLVFLARHGRSFDLLHSQTANTNTWAVLTKPLHGRPVVFSRRTSFVVEPGEEWKTGFKWRHVDLLVAISEMAASEPRRLGIEPVIIRSAVEPHVIDEANVASLVQEYRLSGRKVLATSAALIRDKDPVTLVRAVGELARQRRDVVFLHFGAGGDREAEARAEVQKLGIGDVYLFTGFRKGVEDFYSIMDVFVMASSEEALGSSVLDAFLQKVPVVSTDAGGLKESLADGRGVLVAVGDHQAMAAGMARCLDDLAFRAEVTQRAYDYVRTEHDVTEMGRRYLAEFERLRR
ncbi:glycosyltransferase family 4 protein [Bordetella holmesii]|uniref:Glycosyltransferase, group 1 family protein n=2 Tax=Bordetella holmesii TaxID=35814 RepID=A0A158MA94_9BORD|nr:glycosyltransferase family 4 protein [Bordetella holmesii]AHV91519.1 glycosyl transferases group 1 family protein [Bordetella holmesii ATCC 51541]EWM44075.1 glycosyl transferases group 1 family protein [Bordetella holmesii 41130]EWM51030.1 glycosyl transferases group 1 family protein [Bordetella holmesii 70147]AMD45333.1 glycosyl transferase [Bordetella holmesii H558]AMD49237.1 glycosyl transferase [Bordetella holmesii F627]